MYSLITKVNVLTSRVLDIDSILNYEILVGFGFVLNYRENGLLIPNLFEIGNLNTELLVARFNAPTSS